MSTPGVIPASILNIQIHAIIDLALGAILFIFQIASIAIAPGIVYEQIGIGFWGGLILIATAVAAYKASTGDAPFMLGCTFVLSIFSFICSFAIMCVFAASIDQMNRHGEPCLNYVVVPNNISCTNGTKIDIPACGEYSSSRMGTDSILLICGLMGIPINALLIMGTITTYSPPVAT